MKILLVSDTHGDIESLNKVYMINPDCDYYFHLGDSCLSSTYIKNFLCIKGNCDFENFVLKKDISINEVRFHLEHGNLIYPNLKKYLENIDCDVFLFGHTHCKMCEKINDKIVINPGSLTRPRDDYKGSYAIITFDNLKNIKCQFFYIN